MPLSLEQVNKIKEMLMSDEFNESQYDRYFNEENVDQVLFDDWTPLTLAVECCNVSAVSYFIELGADLEKKGPDRRAALLRAIFMNEKEIVDELLNNKCKVPLYDPDGYPLLRIAITNELVRLVHILVEELNANVNEVDEEEHTTPLIQAAQIGHLEVVKLLIRMGAKINFTPKFGVTALAAASIDRHIPVVLYLLHLNADVSLAKLSIKSRLEEVLKLDLDDVEEEIERLRSGFELLIDLVMSDHQNDISHSRFEFFNVRAEQNKLKNK